MQAVYRGKRQDTPTDWTFRFEPTEEYPYIAGQFSVIYLNLKYPDERGNARTCSFSSSPTEPLLDYTFRMSESGYKKTLIDLVPDTLVELTPARGRMHFEAIGERPAVLIAGGIGVAPYRGMLKYAVDKQVTNPIKLLYFDKTLEELVFKQEFDQMHQQNDYIDIQYSLTRSDQSMTHWDGRVGRVTKELLREQLDDSLEKAVVMVCGSVPMVQTCLGLLQELEIPKQQIIFELFTGY